MSGFAEVREAVLVRNPQPTDILVLRVDHAVDRDQIERIAETASLVFPCKVAVLTDLIRIEAFDGVLSSQGEQGERP